MARGPVPVSGEEIALAGSQPHHPLHQVHAGDFLGNTVLDLQAGIHFQEIERAGPGIVHVLHGAGGAVTDRLPEAHRGLPGLAGFVVAGIVIGAFSALAGIGGGVMTVPFLLWCAVPMRKAVGTAAACTLPVAVAGIVAFTV